MIECLLTSCYSDPQWGFKRQLFSPDDHNQILGRYAQSNCRLTPTLIPMSPRGCLAHAWCLWERISYNTDEISSSTLQFSFFFCCLQTLKTLCFLFQFISISAGYWFSFSNTVGQVRFCIPFDCLFILQGFCNTCKKKKTIKKTAAKECFWVEYVIWEIHLCTCMNTVFMQLHRSLRTVVSFFMKLVYA